MRRKVLLVTWLLWAPAVPAQAQAPAAPESRAELARFADVLDAAVRRVSRPSPFQVLGPMSGGRGFLLPGLGAVFVLPARGLPGRSGLLVLGEGMEPPEGVFPPKQDRLRERVAVRDPSELGDLDQELRRIELQVEAYQREAERASEEAEQALARVAQDLRVRFPEPKPAQAERAAPMPPTAPIAPPAPAAPMVAAAPAAPAAPQATAAVPQPPAPPWRFWFQTEEREDPRPANQIISDVRAAIAGALEAHGYRLRIVRPEEFLVIAVDFTAGAFPLLAERARSGRTLVVKARKKDLDDRAGGRLGAEELQRRIEYVEY